MKDDTNCGYGTYIKQGHMQVFFSKRKKEERKRLNVVSPQAFQSFISACLV